MQFGRALESEAVETYVTTELERIRMSRDDSVPEDVARMAKLKELSSSGLIGGQASYFNHLLDIYGDQGRTRAGRVLTDRERVRIDAFLASAAAGRASAEVAVGQQGAEPGACS